MTNRNAFFEEFGRDKNIFFEVLLVLKNLLFLHPEK